MRYPVIAIEREYASGGREIGQRAADLLGVPCYDSEVLHQAAAHAGLSREYAEQVDETAPSSLLYSLYVTAQSISLPTSNQPLENKLQQAEEKIIRRLAEQGKGCVIIGRCAGAILKERYDCLRVFIHADLESRRQRAVKVYGVDPERVGSQLKRCDRRRAQYYAFYSLQRWDDKDDYHLMLDSSKLGFDVCAQIIAAAAR